MDEKRKDADGSVRAMAVDEQAFWDAVACAALSATVPTGALNDHGWIASRAALCADALLAERRERMGRPV